MECAGLNLIMTLLLMRRITILELKELLTIIYSFCVAYFYYYFFKYIIFFSVSFYILILQFSYTKLVLF